MRIMILNGSPKRDASDTMRMTRAFVDGMNETVENIYLYLRYRSKV